MNIKIVPGILEKTFEELENKLLKASDFCETVFVDVIDGKFVENETIGMDELMDSSTELGFYIHLMTEEPTNYLNSCKEAGAELVVGQVELMENQAEFVNKGKKLGIKTGLALDLLTPIDFLEEKVLVEVETVLLMAVEAGFSEQKFDVKVLKKIKELKIGGFKGNIFIDGGVNKKTIKECVLAGADRFSVTSGIWGEENPAKAYENLVKLAQKNKRLRTRTS
ncbi:MAG: ribulose-phosphate 3-epimerase [Patescibacteria group bacterium]|nr:ribulose-phosphate 3-epimerase [Patescibacteria group bacterium]